VLTDRLTDLLTYLLHSIYDYAMLFHGYERGTAMSLCIYVFMYLCLYVSMYLCIYVYISRRREDIPYHAIP